MLRAGVRSARRSTITVMTTTSYRRLPPDCHPPNDWPRYCATALRHPAQPLVIIPHTLTEITGPAYGFGRLGPLDHDLTRQHAGDPVGERIIVEGRVLELGGMPLLLSVRDRVSSAAPHT